ncbi:MAG: hypothetical protein K0R72_148 [Clostridia bacterium]|jgi:DUF2075 family protein|nr:hypothetical protein [Clostridia bacterium]
MIVYEARKLDFINDVKTNVISGKIYTKFIEKYGKSTSINEIRSWHNSMKFMKEVLEFDNIPSDSGVAIEYKIPNTSNRVDFILTGEDNNRKQSAIIIELKQWENIKLIDNMDGLVETYVGNSNRRVTHPSYQAWSYSTMIQDYNTSVQDNKILLFPCAYLHNYKEINNDPLKNKVYDNYILKAPLFLNGDSKKLSEFISKYIKYGDNGKTLYDIDNGKIRPSKALQDCIKSMLDGNEEFLLLDEQKVVYEEAKRLAMLSHTDNRKRTLIVEGGPGTGKSVLAINLLVDLLNKSMNCFYITKNAAPRNVYSNKLRKGKLSQAQINNLFRGTGIFCDSKYNEFDILIVDEAHRLNAKSGMFKNQGENQIKEIINASKFSIFFIDEHQKIDIYDIGNIKSIVNFAKMEDSEISIVRLESQFRCNGSNGYLAWIDDVLQIRNTANDIYDLEYDIQILDDPNELKNIIFEKNKLNNKARILAGYCWNWLKDGKGNTNIYDIQIPEYNFNMSWNLDNSTTWAIDEESVNEVGCIHTSQGLEFDYVGVIVGKDLKYENGQIITDFTQRATTDNSLKGIKKMYKEDSSKALKVADEIIKNTYRTLMTRGQKGCYVYCEDKKLAEYLKNRIYNKKEFNYNLDENNDKINIDIADIDSDYIL